MYFEDARDLTTTAVQLLQSQKHDIGRPDLKIWPLSEFTKHAGLRTLTRTEKETIVNAILRKPNATPRCRPTIPLPRGDDPFSGWGPRLGLSGIAALRAMLF